MLRLQLSKVNRALEGLLQYLLSNSVNKSKEELIMAISDKVIIITGASSGIGKATAELLAKQGAKLVLAARRKERLTEIQQALANYEVSIFKADVTNFNQMQQLVNFALEKYGRIDVMYNNAGIMPVNPLIKGQRDEWQKTLDVNVMGVLNGIAAVLPTMVKQKAGHILATGSVNSRVTVGNWTVYSASKYAVRSILEGLRQEERENGIKTTLICPGSVHTELYNSIGDPEARAAEIKTEEAIGLDPHTVAEAVSHAIDTPANADVNEVIIRPMGQAI